MRQQLTRTWIGERGTSYGGFDDNAPPTIANAWAANMNNVDAYLFPCAGKDPTDQVRFPTRPTDVCGPLMHHHAQANDYAKNMNDNSVKWTTTWLDIETNPSSGCGWSDDTDSNCQFIQTLASAVASATGQNVGIYASAYMWGSIAGSGCTQLSNLPLWFADYDGVPGPQGFSPFGGWSDFAMKQYDETGSQCGVSYDDNYSQ